MLGADPLCFEKRVMVVNYQNMASKVPKQMIRVNIMRNNGTSYRHLGNSFALQARCMYNNSDLVCHLYEGCVFGKIILWNRSPVPER